MNVACWFLAGSVLAADGAAAAVRPGDPAWPVGWASYTRVGTPEQDAADLKAHGVGLISCGARTVEEARAALAYARTNGLTYHIELPEVTENAGLVRAAKLEPVDAVLIGGVYRGLAVDRHLFSFTATNHTVVIEPPVYSQGQPYTRGSGGVGAPKAAERLGHYFPDMPAPLRAEVVVPLKPFDGRQHLRIVPATVAKAPPGARPEADSAGAALADAPEIRRRSLYAVSFDLSGLDGAMLDRVGLAVYWRYPGTGQYWMFGRGNVSARAESTRETVRREVRRRLAVWTEANGGAFPSDVVLAARYGDECFYITGHLNSKACSLPLWDYSAPSLAAFADHAGPATAYPRTWGYPEIYGADACAWWLYSLHEGCAQLLGVAREELRKASPDVLLFRNTTRNGVFSPSNDADGSGQELLTRQLDVVHLDPYPVSAGGYSEAIPTDMSYCAGLARRYHRLLIPWMQAHTYGGPQGLTDVSPEQVDRMAEEQWRQGVDAVIWLGYGHTFPKVRPDSWERAAAFHARLAKGLPPKPRAELAAVRSYRAWASCSQSGDRVRNPADWLLQQALRVWAVEHERAYDVFEVPPVLTPRERTELDAALRGYRFVLSTEPRDGAWVIGQGTEGQTLDLREAGNIRRRLSDDMRTRGWLPAR